jgi:hypothetical protein
MAQRGCTVLVALMLALSVIAGLAFAAQALFPSNGTIAAMAAGVLGLVLIVGLIIWTSRATAKRQAEREAARRAAIKEMRPAWGDAICDYLIAQKKDVDDADIARIMVHLEEWGPEMCLMLLEKRLALDMHADMVRAALGEPTTIDNREISRSGKKYRWVYGIPRQNATYIWFKNDQVERIKT